MRHNLKEIVGETKQFQAEIAKFSHQRNASTQRTCLLQNVQLVETSETVADHVWITLNQVPELKVLNVGSRITFTGKVTAYRKHYSGDKLLAQDYSLTAIRAVREIEKR